MLSNYINYKSQKKKDSISNLINKCKNLVTILIDFENKIEEEKTILLNFLQQIVSQRPQLNSKSELDEFKKK